MVVPKPIFDVHYADGRTSLVMEADLDGGWSKLQKTYGFPHQMRIPYRDDLTIRAQLTLICQPASFDQYAQEFPNVEMNTEDENLSCRVNGKHLVLKAALAPNQPWRKTPQGRPELYFEYLPLWQGEYRYYDLRAWIVFHELGRRPVPDVRVWAENNLVVPGGQFESNRRRH
jgi:hypothetical protein